MTSGSVRTICASRDELTAEIEEWLARGDRVRWLRLLSAAAVPAGSIRTMDEAYEWEQTRSQGLVIAVEHRVLGRIELPGPALRFGDDAGDAVLLGTPGLAAVPWLKGRVTARTWSTRRRCSDAAVRACWTRWTPQPVVSRQNACAHDVRANTTIATPAPRVSGYLASGTSRPLRIASATSTPNR
jgi:hypothetical protein